MSVIAYVFAQCVGHQRELWASLSGFAISAAERLFLNKVCCSIFDPD